jgi:CBS domain-containing protein
MKIGECCNREVVVAFKDTEIGEAAELMKRHHVGDLVVVEASGGKNVPVGVVTDRDLVVEVLAQGIPLDDVRVGDIMSLEIETIEETEGVWETLEKMRHRGIRRMPVVDSQGALAGLVTLDDFVELFTEAIGNMAGVVRNELSRETRLRRN